MIGVVDTGSTIATILSELKVKIKWFYRQNIWNQDCTPLLCFMDRVPPLDLALLNSFLMTSSDIFSVSKYLCSALPTPLILVSIFGLGFFFKLGSYLLLLIFSPSTLYTYHWWWSQQPFFLCLNISSTTS